MKTASEYRREARDKLAGNLGWAILVLFVYSIILGAASSFIVGTLIFWGPLTVGLAFAYIGVFRRGKFEFNDLFRAFDSNFEPSCHGFYTTFSFFSGRFFSLSPASLRRIVMRWRPISLPTILKWTAKPRLMPAKNSCMARKAGCSACISAL